jgi:hypothetical protein
MTADSQPSVSGEVHFRRRGRGGLTELSAVPAAAVPPGRVPRVSRLMALAVASEERIRAGTVSHADLAREGRVTRARVTQILNLLHLAPDIQEELLFLPRVETGRCPVVLRDLQPIAREPDWRKQRQLWTRLRAARGLPKI